MAWGITYREVDGWVCQIEPEAEAQIWPDCRGVGNFLGFRYFHISDWTGNWHVLKAPWWFLILVFSAILYVVWRKTRPRGTGRAFPVTLTAPRSDPSVKTQ